MEEKRANCDRTNIRDHNQEMRGEQTTAAHHGGDSSLCRQLAVVDPTTTTITAAPFELPEGWTVKKVSRADGSRNDKYFYEPGTGRKFHSLRAVERYLTGGNYTPSSKALKLANHVRRSRARNKIVSSGRYYNKPGTRPKFQSQSVDRYFAGVKCIPPSKALKLCSRVRSSRAIKRIVSSGRLLKLDDKEFKHRQLAIETPNASSPASGFILPDGWVVEEVPRINCQTKCEGYTDKHYYEPGTGRQFHSLKSVQRHLAEVEEDKPLALMFNLGSLVKKCGSQRKISKEKVQTSTFGPAMPPDKINWVLADVGGSTWKPSIGEAMIPESVAQRWASQFMLSVNGGFAAPNFER